MRKGPSDITGQRNAADSAGTDMHGQSEALYFSLVQHLPQNIFRKDLSGRLTFANQQYCQTLKRPLSELLGKTDFDLFPAELAAKYVQDDRNVVRNGAIFETVEAHRLPDGTTIHVQVVKMPVRDAAGNIAGIQGIFWNVTERVEAQETLAASELRYRLLTEATLDGIVLVDQANTIRLFNPAAERMFGYRAAEVIGQRTAILVPPDLRDQHERGFQRYLDTRQPHILGRTVEVRALHKNGSEFPVEIALNAVPIGQPTDAHRHGAVQFLAAIRDLTERNRLRSVLVQSEKLASIGRLSAGMAHEINNPLAFVANNLAVLDRDARGLLELVELYHSDGSGLAANNPALAAKIRQHEENIDLDYLRASLGRILQRTRDGVERVSRIVHSLRGIARTESPRSQEVHLPAIIENALEILQGRFRKSHITIEQEHGADARARCVETHISQVVLNLLINAFQAIESIRKEGGVVRVRTCRRGNEMLIEVEDNGPGISVENQAKLFDPFFTTKDVGEGTGLGLSISHSLVEAHGGQIEVESRPGEGATFRVCLPLQKAVAKNGRDH